MKTTFFLLVIIFCSFLYGLEITHHHINILIKPSQNTIYVENTLSLKGKSPQLEFKLNGIFTLDILSTDFQFVSSKVLNNSVISGINTYSKGRKRGFYLKKYNLKYTGNNFENIKLKLRYHGKIYRTPKQQGQEYIRSFKETLGIVSSKGIYLSRATHWYPIDDKKLITFYLRITQPKIWHTISQGNEELNIVKNKKRVIVWNCKTPMDEIYLCGGKFYVYKSQSENVKALVYLRQNDSKLADTYLEATHRYIAMYNKLIGKYPYTKFALVENFWETGYGMPSFTLLGPRVIRFPFILYSSYPHEILHNWWGNGVFVDYKKGNWCEGLTAYMADHLLKEQRGGGHLYRRQTLQKYRDFVGENQDFPLKDFRARHSSVTEAIGYGKALMVFHELRILVGDELFKKAIRMFYKEYLYKKASFEDIRTIFEKVTSKKFGHFFAQRIEKAGAPSIRMEKVRQHISKGKTLLQFTLKQQGSFIYDLKIPVALTLENTKKAFYIEIPLSQKTQKIALYVPQKVLRIDVDPFFDVWRKLDPSEIPPSIGQIFGNKKLLLVLPSKAPKTFKEQYLIMAKKWSRGRKATIVYDNAIKSIPKESAVWFLGMKNRFAPFIIKMLKTKHIRFTKKHCSLGKKIFPFENHSFLFTVGHPKNIGTSIGWIASGTKKAIRGLTRKLPHYGKYSYLVFEGEAPNNKEKGQWKVISSPMTYSFQNTVPLAILPSRKPLAKLPPLLSRKRIFSHVKYLANPKLEGRQIGSKGIETAKRYIAAYFQKMGLKPFMHNNFFSNMEYKRGPENKNIELTNIIGMLPGSEKSFWKSPVILGAHYDHLGYGWPDVKAGHKGKIHYGADDNASGIAVMLEMIRFFSKKKNKRPILFIAFSGEEAGRIGSKYFISKLSKNDKQNILAMINLDSVGRLFQKPLLILGCDNSPAWQHIFRGCGFVTGVNVKPVMKNLDSSDQVSFIEAGIPAVQIFSGAHIDYHSSNDRVEKIDKEGLLKVAQVTKEALRYLANRVKPMVMIGTHPSHKRKNPRTSKRASFGVIPDFTYKGKGVLVTGVLPKSPASKIELQKGDIVLKLGQFSIQTLRDLAKALRFYQPGAKVEVLYKRNDQSYTRIVILKRR